MVLIEEIRNICSTLGENAEIEMTQRGIAISLFCYEIDFGYGFGIETNSDEIHDVVEKLEARYKISLGYINQSVDNYVRKELNIPEDDFSGGEEKSYLTILVV